jgi:cation diffusion facilitator family transporter
MIGDRHNAEIRNSDKLPVRTSMMAAADIPNPPEPGPLQLAMRLSLAVGFFMLGTKVLAYWMTGSAAILSDAAESVVHVVAVSFAAYSLWLSRKPPDPSHLYGHDKIAFFSAGFEGAMIVLAAFYIVYESIRRLIAGPKLENLGAGALLVLVAGAINGGLGGYLVWVGKRHGSLILEADGRHVLTDCLTSLGVVVGLGLTMLTGWLRFDPIVAILIALDILWMGSKLIRQSIGGLMDEVNPITQAQIRRLLVEMTSEAGVEFHGLRLRNAGNSNWVEFHLLFPKDTSLESAHSLATKIEERIQQDSTMRTEVISHLETLEDHHEVHRRGHFEKLDEQGPPKSKWRR